MSDDRLATKMKTNNAPTRARQGGGSTRIVSRLGVSAASTASSYAAGVDDATSSRRRRAPRRPAD
jgi:hypothetical protein